MNTKTIIRRLTELGLFLFTNPIYLLAIGGIVFLFVVLGGIHSCNSRRNEQKISNTKEKITVGKVESNSLTNQKENVKQEVKNAENNSNQAINNFDDVLRRDSNRYKSSDAGRRFCEKFPEDSSCR